MKKFSAFIALSLVFFTASLSFAESSMLYPIVQDGKWGYIDRAGKIIVEPAFDRAFPFVNGAGIVLQDGLYGYVNVNGKVFVNPKFIEAFNFSANYARVKLAGKFGFIDRAGNFIAQPQYTECFDFASDRARIRNGSFYGFIDTTGKIIIPARYTGADDFSEGLARVNVAAYEIRVSNNVYIHDNYTPVTNYFRYYATNLVARQATNLFVVRDTNSTIRIVTNVAVVPVTNRYTVPVTNSNRVTLHVRYTVAVVTNTEIYPLTNHTILATTNLFVQTVTNRVLELRTNVQTGVVTNRQITMEYVGVFTNESLSNRLCGYVNRTGTMWIQATYRNARSFSQGLAAVLTYNSSHQLKWGYIHGSGAVVIQPQFDDALDFNEGLAPVRSGSRWGYIGTNGSFVIQPAYSYAEKFSGGYARVSTGGSVQNGVYVGGRWELIDRFGRPVGNTSFQWVDRFSEGLARIRQNSQWGFVNLGGTYRALAALTEVYPVREGLARVNVNGKFGYLNQNGNVAIEPVFESASDFHGGLALAVLRSGTGYTFGYIDGAGKYVWSVTTDPTATFRANETVYVLGPGVDLWRTETLRTAEPVKISPVPIGEALVVLGEPRTSTLLSMHGFVGSWMQVDYLDNKGSVFTGYITRLPVPQKGQDIEDYFDKRIGIVSQPELLPNFSASTETKKYYNLGITMTKNVLAGKTVRVFRIPSMDFQQVYAMLKLCAGFPEAPLPEDKFEATYLIFGQNVNVKVSVTRQNAATVSQLNFECRRTVSDYLTATIRNNNGIIELTIETKGTL